MKTIYNLRLLTYVIITGLFLLVACGGSKPATPSPVTPTVVSEQAYPEPGSAPISPQGAYPQPELPSGEAYPMPSLQPTTPVDVVPFRINKPVYAGDSEVSGVGPPGLPIVIGDVTFMGDMLGEGKIGSDGTFVVKLSKPLELDHRIGVALNDLKGTPWESNGFSDSGFFGDEYRQVPMVGFFYDTAAVIAK